MKTAIISSVITLLCVLIVLQFLQNRQIRADSRELGDIMAGRLAAMRAEVQELKGAAEARRNVITPEVAAQSWALIEKINVLEGQGKITRDQAQEYRDELTGKVKYYKAPDGSLTTNRFWTAK